MKGNMTNLRLVYLVTKETTVYEELEMKWERIIPVKL